MGFQMGVQDRDDIELRFSEGSGLVHCLAFRWIDLARDCDPEPFQIHNTSMVLLESDIPPGNFRAYCIQHYPPAERMSDEMLAEVREFIRHAANSGGDIWLSY